MTMTVEKPAVETVKVSIRCSGRRKNGTTCDQLLLRIDADFEAELRKHAEIKCTRCGRIENFLQWV